MSPPPHSVEVEQRRDKCAPALPTRPPPPLPQFAHAQHALVRTLNDRMIASFAGIVSPASVTQICDIILFNERFTVRAAHVDIAGVVRAPVSIAQLFETRGAS